MQMYKNVIQVLQNVCKRCLTVLYPRTCVFCGKPHEKGVCNTCAEKLVYIREPRCKKCGKPIRYDTQEYCYDCQDADFTYEQGRSIWLHQDPVKQSIYQFKYHNRRIYAEFYAREWERLYGKLVQEWGIDLIVPVPLHASRRRKRGYNQAEILAKEFGKRMGIPVDANAVIRKRKTSPQKELDHQQRRRNMEQVFELQRRWERPRRILIIDDIYTSGSTIEGLARILCEKSMNKVWFLTISIGQDF